MRYERIIPLAALLLILLTFGCLGWAPNVPPNTDFMGSRQTDDEPSGIILEVTEQTDSLKIGINTYELVPVRGDIIIQIFEEANYPEKEFLLYELKTNIPLENESVFPKWDIPFSEIKKAPNPTGLVIATMTFDNTTFVDEYYNVDVPYYTDAECDYLVEENFLLSAINYNVATRHNSIQVTLKRAGYYDTAYCWNLLSKESSYKQFRVDLVIENQDNDEREFYPSSPALIVDSIQYDGDYEDFGSHTLYGESSKEKILSFRRDIPQNLRGKEIKLIVGKTYDYPDNPWEEVDIEEFIFYITI
jgi:hypothetical protein